ncbi:3' terminal RNA ribose 2'-O-methyltransferase Hen1 [Pilimelia anulata]|uniref:Small RNA 2'-O-methyltransferase n=1 Tax=Pilimelia anulata TaxID=53371 RepID=A0A8J3AZQ2_9ACTN|nr:3' terminal RNA ribose 2'-O-methyltransferase Hen1 [Pilimelia anulata]GGJ79308.1 3' terminal RNA ribose 2'-O-methyltransferase Hen1 [Pilimelia anulata]
MLLTISTTSAPATDLGYLLVKHPDRAHRFDLAYGTAHVLFPEAGADRCTAALLLEVDEDRLAAGGRREGGRGPAMPDGFALGRYVNDRSYAASSLLAGALNRVFRSALRGESRDRPERAAAPLDLEITVPVLRCRGGAAAAAQLFGPLGWAVEATALPLDERVPGWGDSRYVALRLTGALRLADALNHLYVLLPVLDDAKHYWVSPAEVDKLLRAGTGWLAAHPERELIAGRYLAHSRGLTTAALAQLDEAGRQAALAVLAGERLAEPAGDPDAVADPADEAAADEDLAVPVPVPLAPQRRAAVVAALRAAGGGSVLDLGCGSGALIADLVAHPEFTRITGTDVSVRELERAHRRLHPDRVPERQRGRVTLLQSALTYRDERLRGYDAAVLMEVVEHVDPPRLPALAAAVFGDARPATVVVTTPNAEYNVRYPGLAAGAFRHPDHRFEWTRPQFAEWADAVARRYGYRCRIEPVGPADPDLGPPTQLALFTAADAPTPGAAA